MSSRNTTKRKWGRSPLISKLYLSLTQLIHTASHAVPFLPLSLLSTHFQSLHTTLFWSCESGELPGTRMGALHSTGIDMDSQSRLASSCYWNCYAVKWFLSRFCWITEEWEGDWMGGWSWRCKERPANFCSICCTTIEPLVLTWLNAALPLGSHRLLYCVIISILKKHLLLSYCQFNCVPPWGSQEGDRVCWSPTCFTFLSKAKN